LTDTLVVICHGDTAWFSGTLSGTPPWDLVIDDGSTQITFANLTNPAFSFPLAPASTKTYTLVSLSDATGCETSTGATFTISVQTAPPATITPMGPPAACLGDSVMLMGSVGLNFSYQWFLNGVLLPTSSGHTLSAKSSGNYTVTVMTPAGCSNTSQPLTVTIHPLPMVFLGNDTTLLPYHYITLNAGSGFNSYLWSTGEISQTINVDSAGTGIGTKTVWVHVTDNNTCKGGDTILINFTPHPGIEGTETDASVRIFPNPTNGMVTLELSRFPLKNITVEVYGADGKVAYSRQHAITGENEQIRLNLQHLSDGVYLLKLYGVESVLSQKVIISRRP
jgi:hypothetical protein